MLTSSSDFSPLALEKIMIISSSELEKENAEDYVLNAQMLKDHYAKNYEGGRCFMSDEIMQKHR